MVSVWKEGRGERGEGRTRTGQEVRGHGLVWSGVVVVMSSSR